MSLTADKEIEPVGAKPGRPKGSIDRGPRANRKDMAWNGNEQLQPGDNRKYLRHSLLVADLPPIDIADEKAVEERVNWYFNQCMEDDIKPGVAGLCLALGISRRTFYGWGAGEHRQKTHTAIIERARMILEELWEDYMLNGKINPVVGIFLGKNHFGYTDKQEVTLTPGKPLGEDVTPEQLEEKYADVIVDEIPDCKD